MLERGGCRPPICMLFRVGSKGPQLGAHSAGDVYLLVESPKTAKPSNLATIYSMFYHYFTKDHGES